MSAASWEPLGALAVPAVERLPWDACEGGDPPPGVGLWSRRDRGPDGLVERQLRLAAGRGQGLQTLKYIGAGLGREAPADHGVDCHARFFGETGCPAPAISTSDREENVPR